MKGDLFNGDPAIHFGMDRLRDLARAEVGNSSLIRRAAGGEKAAIAALLIGFWPFVDEFEKAIDKQRYPTKMLKNKYANTFRSVFPVIITTIAEMRAEEESHAKHWAEDAQEFGIEDLTTSRRSEGVTGLVARAYSQDLPRFFAVLAGTEFIAEELSRFLVGSKAYTSQFGRKQWFWGNVHLQPHHGWSHLHIDLDLALSYHEGKPKEAVEEIEMMIEEVIHLFGKAADDVEGMFAPRQAA